MALMQVLGLFLMRPQGVRNASMRQGMAQALGVGTDGYARGCMTYDLRRLRLHCLIERIPPTHRYRITDLGRRVARLFTMVHRRILRPGLSQLFESCPNAPKHPITSAMAKLGQALDALFKEAKLAPGEI